jgi:hypothetical protein
VELHTTNRPALLNVCVSSFAECEKHAAAFAKLTSKIAAKKFVEMKSPRPALWACGFAALQSRRQV